LNEIASSRGLPSYEEFHRQNGIAYNVELQQSSLGVERFVQPERQPGRWVQEDYTQIQRNLAHAQKPASYSQATGTRPTGESPALHQMIMRSNAARDQAAKLEPQRKQIPVSHDRQYLNERQQVLNMLFDNQVFNRTDMQYPYALKDGQKVDDPNVGRMTAVANWILFRSKSIQWTDSQVKQLQQILLAGRESVLSPEQVRQLDIAARLHSILKDNEELPSFQRDDARAFAQGMKVLIEANSHHGQVDKGQLIKDLHFFAIDQRPGTLSHAIKAAGESNAAYNLLAGPRLGSVGWKEAYWDGGEQFHADGKPINQAHHFGFFFAEALKSNNDPVHLAAIWYGARGIDPLNLQDRDLGRLAAYLAVQVNLGKISWQDLPEIIYRNIKE
jgi:hypothetical protein